LEGAIRVALIRACWRRRVFGTCSPSERSSVRRRHRTAAHARALGRPRQMLIR